MSMVGVVLFGTAAFSDLLQRQQGDEIPLIVRVLFALLLT